MNIFETLNLYAGKWNVVGSRSFSEAEIAAVASTEVVPSEFGNSVCFHMVSGGKTYIPLSNQSSLAVGDSIDMAAAKLLTLHREGSKDINRIEA